MLTQNVGMIDRVLRVLIGAALIALALGYVPNVPAQIWGWIGVVPLLTGIVGTCPVYSLFGWRTCPRQSAN